MPVFGNHDLLFKLNAFWTRRHRPAGFQHAIVAVLWIVLRIENGGPFITHADAGWATLAALKRPGFYRALHDKAAALCSACQGVLDRHGLPAIAAGEASFWQILFTKTVPTSYAYVMASDVAAAPTLDLASLKEGLYVLPNVRRFISAVHASDDLEDTVRALDTACRAVNI